MLRALPAKMKQAISNYLAAPVGSVALYQPIIDQAGHRTWQACGGPSCEMMRCAGA